jgi:AraC family transcriptional regulator
MSFAGVVEHLGGDFAAVAMLEGRLEHGVEFAHGRVEIRRHWPGRLIDEVYSTREDVYLLNLALSRRPPPTTITHLGQGNANAARQMGRVILTPPGSRVRITTAPGRSRSLHCALNAELVECLLPQRPVWSEARCGDAAQVDSPELEWLLLKISRELMRRGFGSELLIESLVRAASVELVRRFRLGEIEQTSRHKGGLPPWRMRLLQERVYADAPPPSLGELADICSMTVRQLVRAFKVETGQTVGQFVEGAMVERARALLADSELSIADISQTLGFSHPGSFTYAFRRATGLRPSDIEGRRCKGARG